MTRFIQPELVAVGVVDGRLMRTTAVCLRMVLLFGLVGPAYGAGIVNGDFQTGDLTGWDSNILNPPGSIPVSVGANLVGGNFVGQVDFSNTVGGHYAGSLSQDFYSGAATALTFNFGFNAALQTPGQTSVVDTLDIILFDLDHGSILRHPLHAQNDSTGLEVHTNGLGITANLPLSGSNTHLRLALTMDLQTLDGIPSSAQLSIDNVKLLPEPASWVLAVCSIATLGAARRFGQLLKGGAGRGRGQGPRRPDENGVRRHAQRARQLLVSVATQLGSGQQRFMGLSLQALTQCAEQLISNPSAVIDTSDEPVVVAMPFALQVGTG